MVAAGKDVEELMPPRLRPVEEVLVKPLPRFSPTPKPVDDAVVVAAFVAAAAEVKLNP